MAPGVVERWAVDRFTHPPRTAAGPPDAPGLKARRFELPVGGHRLAVWEWGSGPTVLLVHGWGGHAGQMSRFVAPLVEAGHHAVAFDLPAHGFSTGERATVIVLADAVRAVAQRLGPVAGVIAHSLGATATALALGAGRAPVVLVAPPAELPTFARGFANVLGLPPARTWGMLDRIRGMVGDLEAVDLRLRAPRMTAPVLLIHDVRDREVPFAHGAAVAEAWPGARLIRTEGLGHRRVLGDRAVIDEAVRFATGADDRQTELAPMAG